MKAISYILGCLLSFTTMQAQNTSSQAFGCKVEWDALSLKMDGQRVVPVMGEIHYSRLPQTEWRDEVKKMKDGGVTIIATYVFWNHIEEIENIFNWSGQRNLRHFLEICKEEEMPVILRIGPFCHGEVRCGGMPDWLTNPSADQKKIRLRSEDPTFLALTERLYRQIFTQIQGLQWKDGGPLLACQFDNEYRGHGSYLMALKKLALNIGFDLPFYTRTGWPELSSPVPFGEMLPLYGDYADGFWDRSTKEGAGEYWKAFHFRETRTSAAIASEQIDYSKTTQTSTQQTYPYFTCELGGGMMTSYHRRVYLYPEDAYSMALVKLGSGSNLLGYYMYHGGTNPEGKLSYLNEIQRTAVTNYNDLPVKTYDFQAPLGEFGQRNPHYYSLRKLHLFMHDFGQLLAPMNAVFPQAEKPQKQGEDSYLRWSYRTDGHSAFVFVNNYARFENLSDKKGVQFEVEGVTFPQKPITIPAGAMSIFPVNIDLDGTKLTYATAQLVAQREGKIYLAQTEGIPTEICANGKVLKNVKPRGTSQPVYKNLYLLSSNEAAHLFLKEEPTQQTTTTTFRKTKEAQGERAITIGVNKVAEEPIDEDFEKAATYVINLPETQNALMEIRYQGDCARLYAVSADGKQHFIDDNFYNGRPMLFGLWRLPKETAHMELRILPMQKNMPVYFPREADTTPGEQLKEIIITPKP